jgi:hypothetical protein
MKNLMGLLMMVLITTSCSSIENATSKWKTPEAPDAGLVPGEKSNYLESSISPTPIGDKNTSVKQKKKVFKK